MATSSRKRQLSPNPDPSRKRSCHETDNGHHLLNELTGVLAEIESTPSSGEISAALLENLRLVMLEIEDFASDPSNLTAIQTKQETERCLESWFDDLVARCEADGELDLDFLEQELAATGDEDDDADEDDECNAEEMAYSIALSVEEQDEFVNVDLVDDMEEEVTVDKAIVNAITA